MATISDMILSTGRMSPWASLSSGINRGVSTASNLQNMYGQALMNRYRQQQMKQAQMQAPLQQQLLQSQIQEEAAKAQFAPQLQQANIARLMQQAHTSPARFSAFQDWGTGKTFVLDKVQGSLLTPAQAYHRGWRGLGTNRSGAGGQVGAPSQAQTPQPAAGPIPPPTPPGTGPLAQAVTQQFSDDPFAPNPDGTTVTLNPYTVGTRSKKGAQYSVQHPDGSVTVHSSPTQAAQTFAEKRQAARSEIQNIKTELNNWMAPYSGTGGLTQAKLQKDLAAYKTTGDPKLFDSLANFYAIKLSSGPAATLFARAESGGVPHEGSIKKFTDFFEKNTANLPFDMPQDIVVEGKKRAVALQQKMIDAADQAYIQGFPIQAPPGTKIEQGLVMAPQGAQSPAQSPGTQPSLPAAEPQTAPQPTIPQTAPPAAPSTQEIAAPEVPQVETKAELKKWYLSLNPQQKAALRRKLETEEKARKK